MMMGHTFQRRWGWNKVGWLLLQWLDVVEVGGRDDEEEEEVWCDGCRVGGGSDSDGGDGVDGMVVDVGGGA